MKIYDNKKLVVNADDDDLSRHRMMACIYCGNTTAITRDHVISVSWSGFKRNYGAGDTVKCCKECNIALRDLPLHSISQRANFLAQYYSKKFRRILRNPSWKEEEILEMSDEFQVSLRALNDIKKFYNERIGHCVLISLEDSSLVDVKQAIPENAIVYRILNDLFYGYGFEEVSEKYEIPVNRLKSMFKEKKYTNIVTAFKYERGIPFDLPLYKLLRECREKLSKNLNAGSG